MKYINLIGQVKTESDILDGKGGAHRFIWRVESDLALNRLKATIKFGKSAGINNTVEWAGNRLRMEGVQGISPAENYL